LKNLVVFFSIVLLGWLFLVLWDSPTDFFFRDKKSRVEDLPTADSYMLKTATSKFDAEGHLSYQLYADTGYYFTRDDRFELHSPKLLVARKTALGSAPWELVSEQASSMQHGKRILLEGAVHAWQDSPNGKNEIFTRDLTYFPDQNIAKTGEAVKLLHPTSITKGTGMVANFTTETYRLTADVEGTYRAR
jgi:LPS export ABC transporter protein LptC